MSLNRNVLFGTLIFLFLISFAFADYQSLSEVASDSIKQRALDISKQIEIYLDAHSEMSLEDLRGDSDFQDIAVQQVGDTGYTYLVVKETGLVAFHLDPDVQGESHNIFKEEFPAIWGILDEAVRSKPCKDSFGFYNWRDIEDNIREKYTYQHCVDGQTSDGYGFFIGASTYLDEYDLVDEGIFLDFNQIILYVTIFIVILFLLVFFYLGYAGKGFLTSKINRKLLVWFLVISIIPVALVSFVLLQSETEVLTENSLESHSREILAKVEIVKEILEDFKQDVLIISGNEELDKLVNAEDEFLREELKEELKKDLLAFSKHRMDYYQIRYIDENGEEVVRIDNDGENVYVVSDSDLQNKAGRYYFDESMVLDLGEIFISPLDLNIEGGELENRGTAEEPIYIPVIRYATPVFDEQGKNKGIIIINVYANSVLMFVREEVEEEGTSKMLIDSDGQFLFHPKSRKEFSFMFKNRDYSFGLDYPEENSEVLGKNKGAIYNEDENYYVLFERVWIGDSFWVLVNVIDEDVLLSDVINLRSMLLMLGIFLVIGVSSLSFFFSRKITKPIGKLYRASKELQKRNFGARVNVNSGDELEVLGRSFNQTAMALGKMDEEHEQLEKAKTEFLSITSHELRSPMTPMQAQLQMLLGEYYGKLNAKQRNAMEIVSRNTKRLDRIIVDFLEISRIEAARLKFRFVKKNPADIIPRLVREMSGFMPEKKIKIVTKIGRLPVIEHDKDRLSQVLRNLINNAIKFSKSNTTITVSAKLKDGMIEFSVADQGIGIDEKSQKRIFEPFYQVEQTIYREHQGTGLGLAIIKGIVESQEGDVWLESEVGKGTTFFFTLPLKPVKVIKPIKLLFSPKKDRDKKIKFIFTEVLGPMGISEFDNLGRKNQLTKKDLVEYIGLLVRKGILSEENGEVFKSRILDLFGKGTGSSRTKR